MSAKLFDSTLIREPPVDPLLNITDVNETMCTMSGYARSHLIGSAFPGYFVDSRRAAEGVRLTLVKGAVTNYELTLKKSDGRAILVSFNAAIFKDQSGIVRGIFASARDITEQSQLQTQLAEERAYNRGLSEASVDGLVTVDESMTITDVNETMCRMASRTRNQLVGSSFPSYFTNPQRAAEGVRLTFQQGAVTNYVLNLQGADGHHIPVSFDAAVFRGPAGEVRGIFAGARDITDQKQLEQQLRDSHFYTCSLIESNIDALMPTNPLGIITDVNQRMEALTGCTREELIGTPFKRCFTDPHRAEQGIRQVLREGRVTNYEITARSKAGKHGASHHRYRGRRSTGRAIEALSGLRTGVHRRGHTAGVDRIGPPSQPEAGGVARRKDRVSERARQGKHIYARAGGGASMAARILVIEDSPANLELMSSASITQNPTTDEHRSAFIRATKPKTLRKPPRIFPCVLRVSAARFFGCGSAASGGSV